MSVQSLYVLVLGLAKIKKLGSTCALQVMDSISFSYLVKVTLGETNRSSNENFWLSHYVYQFMEKKRSKR
jgi:hypothetical protein